MFNTTLPKPQLPNQTPVQAQSSNTPPTPPSVQTPPMPPIPTAATTVTSVPPLGSASPATPPAPLSPIPQMPPLSQQQTQQSQQTSQMPPSIPQATPTSTQTSQSSAAMPVHGSIPQATGTPPTATQSVSNQPPSPQGMSQGLPTQSQPPQPAQVPTPLPTQPKPAASQPLLTPAKANNSLLGRLTGGKFGIMPLAIVGVLVVGLLGFGVMSLFGGNRSSVGSPSNPSNPGTNAGIADQNQSGTGSNPGGTVPTGNQVTLTYWGLWEPTEALASVLEEFQTANPGVRVEYVKQNHVDYRERLQTAIASGTGPDLFRYHASWVPMLSQELAALPSSIMSVSEYQNTFFPVAAQQLQHNGQLVGIPLMYDGLGLYINTEIFRQAAIEEPKTWADVKTAASQLTIRNSNGEVERGGLAIGNASNVEHFADILGLLMLQNGANPLDPTTKAASDALAFYTGFYKNDKVWSDRLPTSTVAFARGEVAMMFAPSWRVHEIKAMNPAFADFKIIPTPTLGEQQITWASYWAEGVNSKSTNQEKEAAWKLLAYLSSAEVMQKMYSDQAQTRSFGEPYSRKDLAQSLSNETDPIVQNYVAPYLESAPQATGWYLNSYTHDSGINDQLIQYYRDAINAVLQSTTPDTAMTTVGQGTQQVLRQYGVQQ